MEVDILEACHVIIETIELESSVPHEKLSNEVCSMVPKNDFERIANDL